MSRSRFGILGMRFAGPSLAKATIVLVLTHCIGSIGLAEPATTNRPAQWAKPIALEGVPNLHQVSETLYRSGQPTAEGMRNLKKMGIKTVLNLRSFHSDRDEIGTTGLGYEHIYMKAWHPEEKEVVRFLKIVTDPTNAPVLVHCWHGADRTGALCALYRVALEGWTKEDAVREMTEGGYGYHTLWHNLMPWIRDIDVPEIKKKAGLTPKPPVSVPAEPGHRQAPAQF